MDEILAAYDKLNILYKNLAKSFIDLEKVHLNNQILNGFFKIIEKIINWKINSILIDFYLIFKLLIYN